jgi:hypothetical protein
VSEVEGREKERGWCPSMMERRVVLPEPEVVSGREGRREWRKIKPRTREEKSR